MLMGTTGTNAEDYGNVDGNKNVNFELTMDIMIIILVYNIINPEGI